MIPVGRITQIWRYPVKSMGGERLAESAVGHLGLHADRVWAVRDLALDATTSAKRLPVLLSCTARFAEEPGPGAGPGDAPGVVIALPDGSEVSSADPAVHARLSELVGRAVELRPLPPAHQRKQYRGPMLTQADMRQLLGLGPEEPIPDMSMFPLRKLAEISRYVTPVGSYADVYPVHLITEASLRTMSRLSPGTDFDIRRFRPTAVVEGTVDSDFPEWDWCGGVLCAPGAELAPEIPTIRCVMPTHTQPGLARDREVTRAVAQHARRCLGVYGSVSTPGRLAEGDELRLRPARRSAVAAWARPRAENVKRAVLRAGNRVIPKGTPAGR